MMHLLLEFIILVVLVNIIQRLVLLNFKMVHTHILISLVEFQIQQLVLFYLDHAYQFVVDLEQAIQHLDVFGFTVVQLHALELIHRFMDLVMMELLLVIPLIIAALNLAVIAAMTATLILTVSYAYTQHQLQHL